MTRLLAAVLEAHHDKRGIVWPPAVAPWPGHLLHTGRADADSEVRQAADRVYELLGEQAALYDDRAVSAASSARMRTCWGCRCASP